MYDPDLIYMSPQELADEVMKLREAIRADRDATGHNLCWYRPELWNLLPEKVEPKPQVPPRDEFMRCCGEFRSSLDGVDDKK